MEKCIFTESSRETRTSLNTSEGISAVDIVILRNIPRKEYFGSLLLLLGKDGSVRAARVKVASADRNLTTSQFYQIIQIWSNLKIYFSCIHNNKKEGSPFSFHRHHKRPRRSVCQYTPISIKVAPVNHVP